ncbi:forkhead box protein M1-like [Megalops cyprinoides]|uniref:forkhead box protein M1-like n=1 Tax=Megalops cyprinoides TaxID=118141 RepID=UPI001863A133|nr:forkhead box protein M1-like [Megalops cyprinoides]
MENPENKENGMDLDNSLTNINWLGRFSCHAIVPEENRRVASKLKVVKPPTGNPVKRPQHSYTELIKLALLSAPGRRLTLQQIYSWVEDHFPYYKYHAKPGWRNSIRHSLSTQDIFVREAAGSGRNSYWMMKPCPQSNILLSLERPKNVTSSDMVAKKDFGKKKMLPLLPRSVLHCLVPVSVVISTPAISAASLNPAACLPTECNTKRVIAPKLPIAKLSATQKQTTDTSQVSQVSSHSSKDAIIVRRWNRVPQQSSRQRRKQRLQTLEELHSPLQASLSTSIDSGLGCDKTSSSKLKMSYEMVSPSTFTTPIKSREELVTSTPCTDLAPVSPSEAFPLLETGRTPPASKASFLDGSFFKSHEARIVGEEDFGLRPFRDNTQSGNCHRDDDLSDFSFLSFTPIRGTAKKEGESGFEAHNESLGLIFADFSPGLEQGTDLVNMSWSEFT